MRRILSFSLGILLLAGCSKPHQAAPAVGESPAAEISDAEASSLQAEADAQLKAMSHSAVAPVDSIALRTGLWEVTYRRDEMGFRETRRICVGKVLAETLAELPASPETLDCRKHELKIDGRSAHIESVCAKNGTTVTGHIEIEMGQDTFHQEMETLYEPAFAGHGDVHATADGKRVGDCPAGMAQGASTVVTK
ncbi:DUF3617 family protein [Asticcacaulis solisilvae]|uniref:DUF3617 family protein n=1 Tax=Asticcacaulis solisilvae TaxID=1217274 RepID=UPI003FD6D102